MWILPLVGYTGILLGFGFLTLAIGTRARPLSSCYHYLPSYMPPPRESMY